MATSAPRTGSARAATVAASVIFSAQRSRRRWLSKARPQRIAGLHGIIGKEVPNDLGPEPSAGLTGNWESWGKGLSALVNKLYTDEKLDLAGQRPCLSSFKEKSRRWTRCLPIRGSRRFTDP